MRTVVVFQSKAFNTTEPRPYFINPECFGDDVARWLINRLRAAGVEVRGEPGQEDFGWYIDFVVEGAQHSFVLGARRRDDEGFEWVGIVERSRGLLGSALGLRRKGVRSAAVRTLHATLSSAPDVSCVLWHEKAAFDRSDETQGNAAPE